MKVLIFDDVLFRRQRSYAIMGLEVSFHEHADEALTVVLKEGPDLVCMDFSMDGERNGSEAVAQLRLEPRLSGLRIIAISSDPQHNARMLAAGANDAVPKTHLRAFLKRLLEKAQGPGP